MATYSMRMPGNQYPGQYLPISWAYDYNPSMGELLDYGRYTTSTTGKAVYRMESGVDLVINGSGFTYNSQDGTLHGGKIVSLAFVSHDTGATIQTVTGLNWSGSSFYETVTVGNSWFTTGVILNGNDTVKGSAGHDEIYGYGGNDKLYGGDGADNFIGGRGADKYDGGPQYGGVDQLSFDDAYRDASGARGVVVDMQKGTATDPWGYKETFSGIERIKGTQFVDKLYGSSSNDQFRPLGGADYVDGKGGNDTIRYDRDIQRDGNKGVTVDLAKGYGIDGFGARDTLKNIEDVVATSFNDKIIGSSARNTLSGLEGNDRIYGGSGKDTLIGGLGKDVFVFDTKLGRSNIDTITDFSTKDDTIWLDNDIFKKLGAAGDLATASFYSGRSAHDASDRIIYDKSNGKLFYDADGKGGDAGVQFAQLSKGLAVTAADFDIIG